MKAFQPFLCDELTRLALVWGIIVFLGAATADASMRKARRFIGFNDGLIGTGLMLGEPTSGRLLYFTHWKRAFSLSGGYSFSKVGVGSLDYLFYGYSIEDRRKSDSFWNSLIFYGGPGIMGGAGVGGHAVEDKIQYGFRAVGGVEYVFGGSHWSLRLEGAPQYLLKGKSSFGMAIGLGLTYYFFDSGVRPRKDRFLKKEVDEFEEFREQPAESSDDEFKEFE